MNTEPRRGRAARPARRHRGRSGRPARPAGRARRGRRRARRRLPHGGHPGRHAAAGRDRGRAGQGRVPDRGPRRGPAAPRRADQPRVLRAPARLDAHRRELGRVLRRPAPQLRPAARLAASPRVPPRGAGPPARHRLRADRLLRAVAAAGGQPAGIPCGGHRVRDQSPARRRALPPGDRVRRTTRPLPGRPGRQAVPARIWRQRYEAGRNSVDGADWTAITAEVDDVGCALTPRLLTAAECGRITGLYDRDDVRSTVEMARYRFGEGEYKYFARRSPSRSSSSSRRSTRGCCRSPATGTAKLGRRPRGRARWTSGWSSATRPGRRSPRRSC